MLRVKDQIGVLSDEIVQKPSFLAIDDHVVVIINVLFIYSHKIKCTLL